MLQKYVYRLNMLNTNACAVLPPIGVSQSLQVSTEVAKYMK
jgi:hypothetical protein